MKIALATCVKLPEPDVDEALLVAGLEAAGASVRMLAWDAVGDGANADSDELVVVRSTWNYFENIDDFLAWVDRTSTASRALLNPAAIIRDTASKTYLRDLQARGIEVVPTAYVMRGEKHRRVAEIAKEHGWRAIVIKPTVSAGSFLTKRFESSNDDDDEGWRDAQAFLDDLTTTRERDVMVQRWMPSVDTYGERSIVWIDGQLTHAIRKSPRFTGGSEAVSAEIPIADDERAFALRIVDGVTKLTSNLLYARVDMVKDEEGVLRLMELEMIEPSLFLKQCPAALDRLVAAILRRASQQS